MVPCVLESRTQNVSKEYDIIILIHHPANTMLDIFLNSSQPNNTAFFFFHFPTQFKLIN